MSEAATLTEDPRETIPQTVLRICKTLVGKPISENTLYTGVPIIDCELQLRRS